MDNVLTILIAVGGIAISLYMNARKKEKQKAKTMQEGIPQPKKNIFETILSETDWDLGQGEAKPKPILIKKEVNQNIDKPTLMGKKVSESDLSEKRIERDKQNLIGEVEAAFDSKPFNLQDAVIYQMILERKY